MEDNRDFDTHQEDNQAGNEQEERTFTQAEVDEIVNRRLARERRRQERTNDTDIDEREKALTVRELKCMAREKLFDAGMPASLADVLSYSDEKSLESAIDAIKSLNPSTPKAWGQRMGHVKSGGDPIRKAMGLDHKS